MAPKAYTRDRIVALAASSAAKARSELQAAIEHLGCDFVRPLTAMKRTTDLTFKWSFQGGGYNEEAEVTSCCNYVFDRAQVDRGAMQTAWSSETDESGFRETSGSIVGG